MERFICIHGHFYQPPRENPWLEAIEIQDSAYPYHDWNERVTAECYAPNSAARNLDGEGRIRDIVSNYARISFNFGPTLLSWMEQYAPETYRAILEADRQSREWRSGHGNAIAQIYNHVIMPLATERDKRTQIIWGIRDFEHRFGRFPEGMWLAETAVDLATLELLAAAGIGFTILAQRQARAVRRLGTGKWKEVSGGRGDPTRAYLCRLPSGRKIQLFFYDDAIARAVAFGDALTSGEAFAHLLLGGFSDQRAWPQLLHIATDGETYGHHHQFGDMALCRALSYLEENGLATLTNYGAYLERHPATHEVRILENSSWSCSHGIERWRGDCGCATRPQWHQQWRAPLREAVDWLNGELAARYERHALGYLREPWRARDRYVDLLWERSEASIERFLAEHGTRALTGDDRVIVLKLLELQRHALLMFTSCGWFFDEISGLETVQVLQYAGRALQLAQELFQVDLATPFRERLAAARSNLVEHGDGALIYDKFVTPTMIGLIRVGAHYAVSSLFEEYPDETTIFNYRARQEEIRTWRNGPAGLAIGRALISSLVTRESSTLSFCVLHFGNHLLNGWVRFFRGDEAYGAMKEEVAGAFEKSDFPAIIQLMQSHFGEQIYSLRDLFRDEQRKVLGRVIAGAVEDYGNEYLRRYEKDRVLMGFLLESGMPVPREFLAGAEMALNLELRKAFAGEKCDRERVAEILAAIGLWNFQVDAVPLEFLIRRRIESCMLAVAAEPANLQLLAQLRSWLEIIGPIPVQVNLWQVQNLFYRTAKRSWNQVPDDPQGAEEDAMRLLGQVADLGRLLHFNVEALVAPHQGESNEPEPL